MKINQRKAGALLSYLLTVVNALAGFVYIPMLIYFLGQKEYGLYLLIGSFLIYLGLFDFGLTTTVTQYYSRYKAAKDGKAKENLLALSFILYAFLTVLLLFFGTIFYFYIDDLFKSTLTYTELVEAKKMYIVILIIVAITLLTSIFHSIITSNEKFIFLTGLSILQTVLRPIIVFSVFSVESSAFILIIIQGLLTVLGIVLKVYYCLFKLKVKIKYHHLDLSLIKEMLKYSFFIFITILMDQIFWRADQVILGIFVGTASVAIYSIGSQIVMYFLTLSTAMTGVFLPSITKQVSENVSNVELTKIFVKIGRLQYILLGGVLIGFILFGKEFIVIWVGESFTEAYYITLIILIPFMLDLIQNIGLTILQAKSMYSFRAMVFFVMSLLNIGLSIPLAIHYGGVGAAIATGVAYIIGNGVIMNIYYYKKVGLDIIEFWKDIFKLSIPMLFLGFVGILINQINLGAPVTLLIIKLGVFSILYVGVIFKFGMNRYEKNLLLKPFQSLLS